MGTRILTFHYHETAGNEVKMSPSAYYIEADYTPLTVAVYAENAPTRDAKFDILDDGVSIFNNRTPSNYDLTTGRSNTGAAVTAAVLPTGQNSDECAEDFTGAIISEGSWISCNLVDGGGGKNFSVHLTISSVVDDEDDEE